MHIVRTDDSVCSTETCRWWVRSLWRLLALSSDDERASVYELRCAALRLIILLLLVDVYVSEAAMHTGRTYST
jgi:hypothetical protein